MIELCGPAGKEQVLNITGKAMFDVNKNL